MRCGLAAGPGEAEVVVVHDAARPLPRRPSSAPCSGRRPPGEHGAVPVVPVDDTIEQVDGRPTIMATLDRNGLVAVQTPQGFRAPLLRRAPRPVGRGATDDAGLVEAVGGG